MVYVDDGILSGPDQGEIQKVIDKLQLPSGGMRAFKVLDEGEIDNYLGIKVQSVRSTIMLMRPRFIQKIQSNLAMG